MMNSQTTIPTTRLQAFARRLLLASCTVLLMGVMGAAAIRVDERGQVVNTGAQAPMLAAFDRSEDTIADPIPAAEPELLQDATQAMAQIDVIHKPRTIRMEVTAYCPCEICCGPEAIGLTASGKHVSYNDGQFVAADTDLLPFGTKLVIPGYAGEQPVEVIDRGGAIKGRKLDVYFSDHEVARHWGRQMIEVTVAD